MCVRPARGRFTLHGRGWAASVIRDNGIMYNRFHPLRDRSETDLTVGYSAASDAEQLDPDDDDMGYEKVVRKKMKNRRVISGNANMSPSTGFRGDSDPSRDLFIFRVHSETDTGHLKGYLIG